MAIFQTDCSILKKTYFIFKGLNLNHSDRKIIEMFGIVPVNNLVKCLHYHYLMLSNGNTYNLYKHFVI